MPANIRSNVDHLNLEKLKEISRVACRKSFLRNQLRAAELHVGPLPKWCALGLELST